jgi:hypothetical protein
MRGLFEARQALEQLNVDNVGLSLKKHEDSTHSFWRESGLGIPKL